MIKKMLTIYSATLLCGCGFSEVTTNQEPQSITPSPPTKTSNNKMISEPEIKIEPPAPEIVLEKKPVCEVFDDFSGTQDVNWQRVNDNVMGGRSTGGFEIIDQSMVLSGSINLNGGGFTSVRAPLPKKILENFDAVTFLAKSDGRGYDLTFRDEARRNISHRAPLDLKASEAWQEVMIKFSDLAPAFFGRPIDAQSFNKDEAREIGIILNDGLGGGYELSLKEIRFCKSAG